MSQIPVTQITVNKSYVDLPEVKEIFADHVRLVMVADGIAHIELCSTHFDEPPTGGVLSGKMYPVVRVAVPMATAAMLNNLLSQHVAPLPGGLPPQAGTTSPKH